ncbi:TetR/AcrR family transcriptional regulator [Leifsonia shinshuensis]|uniref:AcrR family transcriptional regulator n=1 Tax=Leifsonia shinshuensis TaxID=150026 RepID=A0A853CR13_9MICO|nr:TetR/AcrR family transcriptional regulator [Leifsonia shinshuensis]NYJ23366.1 AcrR family transcriptional regulator [Leifsonia shinshuensis]
MPKVTEEYRTARRHEIAQAALRCFARNGFAATSMADIIAESGLSAGAIYGHFTSKDELMELTASEILDARFLEVEEARARQPLPTPGEIVRMLVTGLTTHLVDLQLLVQVWGQVPINPRLKQMSSEIGGRIRAMFAGYLTDWHAQTLPVEEARALAARQAPVYMGLVQGYVTQTVLFDGFDGETYLAVVASMSLAD